MSAFYFIFAAPEGRQGIKKTGREEVTQGRASVGGANVKLPGKGADLASPCVSLLASPHRPKASDGAFDALCLEYI